MRNASVLLAVVRRRLLLALLALACVSGESVATGVYYIESDVINIGATDLVLNPAGFAHVSGIVDTYSFPGIDSSLVTNAGFGLRYVAKIDLATRKPQWVAVVGAPTKSLAFGLMYPFVDDEARGLAVHANGYAYLVAHDGSANYPLTGGQYRVATAKHVFRVSATGQVARFSIALDPAIRRVGAIAVDAAGNIYLTGSAGAGLVTSSGAPFPSNSVAAACIAPFVMKLDATGQLVTYATYLGVAGTLGERCGAGSEIGIFDPTGFAMAVDSSGNVVVGGQAEPGVRATAGSPDTGSKTPTSYIPVLGNYASHAFVAKINATGTAIVFIARLGGSERDRVTSVVLDSAGAIYVGGKTASRDFPTTPHFGPLPPVSFLTCPGFPAAPEVGFVTKLAADGKQLIYSGYLPVYGEQIANCGGNPYAPFDPLQIAVDASGRVYATGPESSLRAYTAPKDSILTLNPSAVFFVIAPSGLSIEYSTRYGGLTPRAAAIDAWGHFWVAGEVVKRFSEGLTPLEFTHPIPLCATAGTLSVHVAGANNLGTVDFFVDGVAVGTMPVVNSIATKSLSMSPGMRRVVATYHGPSYFDGYSTEPQYVPVNQAGAC
ncbi:MAG: hypothetical protein ABI777_00850 [Betaproteobacteria bacterium]